MKNIIRKIAGVSLLILIAGIAWAGMQPTQPPAAVKLAWDATTDPTVGSYNVYVGGASRNYTNLYPASLTNTSVIITPLVRGATYYFAATSVGTNGLESDFSNEIVYVVPNKPNPPVLRLAILANGQVQIAITSDPNNTVIVQASEDLHNWVTLGQVTPGDTGKVFFVDVTAPWFKFRFYRTVC